MLIIKPYGRSRTAFDDDGRSRRRLHLNAAPDKALDIVAFGRSHPELVIAQWISTIDKIATKPSSSKKPTTEQRALRDSLGRAAFATMVERDRLPGLDARRAEIEALWWSKIHPYAQGTDGKVRANPKGRWYARFAGRAEVSEVDPAEIAKKIDRHLHDAEFRTIAQRSLKRKGRIEARTESIECNVLRPAHKEETDDLPWTPADKSAYVSAGDVAALISRAAHDAQGRRQRVTMRLIAPILYQQYGRLFRDDGGETLSIAAARDAHPGLFALHSAIRESFRRHVDGQAKSIARKLPETMDALFHLVECRQTNRQLNDLVRLGKVIHYEATPPLGADTPRNVFDHWPRDTAQSHYWTSDGQSEIKRNEAFVRVWRGLIALAARTLTDWADPSGRIEGDILGAKQTGQAIGPAFDEAAFDHKAAVLYGERASLLGGGNQDLKKAVLNLALTTVSRLRNSSFHFKGRHGFAQALKNSIGVTDPMAGSAARSLWQSDAMGRAHRLKEIMRGAHFEAFFADQQNQQIYRAITAHSESGLPLPGFRRILDRATNAWDKEPFVLRLPEPGNHADLQVPTRLSQYVALKLLYERAFPSWLGNQEAETLNIMIDHAIERTTTAARKMNQDERAIARAAGLIRLNSGQTIDLFLDRLSAETAREFRVQRKYDADPENARKQSQYLEDFRCDVIAQAFERYLNKTGFEFLLSRPGNEDLPEHPPCDLDDLPDMLVEEEPEDWQAVLYLVVHLVPVDEIVKLMHQLRKWTVLEGRPSADVRALQRAFDVYRDMHDAKFEGGPALTGSDAFEPLFENDELYRRRVLESDLDDHERAVARRGFREMLRFGDLGHLLPFFQAQPITAVEVSELEQAESEIDGVSAIAAAQGQRQALHEKWVKQARDLTDAEKRDYCHALAEVIRHRHLANQVNLTNHLRLHRLLMQVLGRLVDYAGLWERDLYFVTLALLHLEKTKPEIVFPPGDKGRQRLADGRIVDALRQLGKKPSCSHVMDRLKALFGSDFLDGEFGMVCIRNDLAHFNMLRRPQSETNLTDTINRTRRLMSYDRKLKNAVSKSVKELLQREGLELAWRMTDHSLSHASLQSRQARHIESSAIMENLHGDAFVALAAGLFGGTPQQIDDVLSKDIEKIDWHAKQSGRPSNRHKTKAKRPRRHGRGANSRHRGRRKPAK